MRIQELHLENFRCFEKLDFKFPKENLAVFIGNNGSGKSSLLDAIKTLLFEFLETVVLYLNNFPEIEYNPKDPISKEEIDSINLEDINFNSNKARISCNLSYNSEGIIKSIDLSLKRDILKYIRDQKTEVPIYYNIYEYIKDLKSKLIKQIDFSLPIYCYYKYLSLFEQEQDDTDFKYHISQCNAYVNALSSKLTTFTDFFNWFRQEEDYENELRLREDINFRNPNLELIRKTITKFLSHFPNTQFSDLRIVRTRMENLKTRDLRFNLHPVTPVLVINKNGQDFNIAQLSDGEKTLLMLVVDIARRLAIANPSLGENAHQGEGIILIDEIESHLHPQWQRIVIPALMDVFPNCQFIITTHSPQVLSNIHKECVFILEDSQIVKVTPYTYGRDSNSILSEVMLVSERPEEMQKKIDDCFQLIDEDKLEEAKQALTELSDLLGKNDSEIVRAETLIDFLNS